MRVLFLAVALLLPTSVSSAAADPSPVADMPVFNPRASGENSAECPPTSRFEAAKGTRSLRPRHLDELPMADAYAAVYRHIGRCEAPIIVRYGIGAPKSPALGSRR